MIYIEEVTTPDVLKARVKAMVEASGAPAHPVLKEAALYLFWGAYTLVMWGNKDQSGSPLSINQTKIGKRKKNAWEPVMNWYSAYTLPAERRKGHAYRLYAAVEGAAVAAGCRHVKSLAGSRAGLGLHRSLHHRCWGRTPNGEVFVYSPLPGHEALYSGGHTPPQAPGTMPMSSRELDKTMKEGLRYDR